MTTKQKATTETSSQGLVKVSIVPAVIDGNLTDIERQVDEIVEQCNFGEEGLEIAPEDAPAIKRQRAYINNLTKSLQAERIRVEQEFMAPWIPYRDRCKALESKLKGLSTGMKSALDKVENEAKAHRTKELQDFYVDFAPALVPVVPFERILDPKWLNKSFGTEKAKHALADKVDAIAKDWKAVTKLAGDKPYFDVAEREFYRTLDMSAAIAAMEAAAAEDAKLKTLHEEVPTEALQAPLTDKKDAPVQTNEGAPENLAERLTSGYTQMRANGDGARRNWIVEIEGATTHDMANLAQALQALGLTGRMYPEQTKGVA